ncbi:hypothetical protein D7V82_02200 [bacterium 1xD8-6]|nr:hypothetical protein D7V72_01465 [bacterium D16-36]RKI72842.1 hypothetical protein D7V82_02200 [bacterium 1xD8-6]
MDEVVHFLKQEIYLSKMHLNKIVVSFLFFAMGSIMIFPDIIFVWGFFLIPMIRDIEYEKKEKYYINMWGSTQQLVFKTKIFFSCFCTVLSLLLSTVIYHIAIKAGVNVFKAFIGIKMGNMSDIILLLICASSLFSVIVISLFTGLSYNLAFIYQIILMMGISFLVYLLLKQGILSSFWGISSLEKKIIMIVGTFLAILMICKLKLAKIKSESE